MRWLKNQWEGENFLCKRGRGSRRVGHCPEQDRAQQRQGVSDWLPRGDWRAGVRGVPAPGCLCAAFLGLCSRQQTTGPCFHPGRAVLNRELTQAKMEGGSARGAPQPPGHHPGPTDSARFPAAPRGTPEAVGGAVRAPRSPLRARRDVSTSCRL